jgi:hypothetical protein
MVVVQLVHRLMEQVLDLVNLLVTIINIPLVIQPPVKNVTAIAQEEFVVIVLTQITVINVMTTIVPHAMITE